MSTEQNKAPSQAVGSSARQSGRRPQTAGKYFVMGSDAPAPSEVRQQQSTNTAAPSASSARVATNPQANSPFADAQSFATPRESVPEISVVIPVYGCPAALPSLHERLVATLKSMGCTYEIILVDDACPQGSWAGIQDICELDKHVQGIRLSRNFGQIMAITAGLNASCGNWVVVMDCDLQDRPEAIASLYAKAQEGYDVVFARRRNRKDSASTTFFSRSFYKVYDYFTDGHYDPDICNFSISKRIVIDNYCRMPEQQRAYAMFIKWLGFNQTTIDVEGDERFEGDSSYTFGKKMRLANALITAQSNKPLYFAINLGFGITLLAFIYLLVLLINYLVRSDIQPGWTSVMGAVFFMGGIILAAIGITGAYIGNIFTEVKNRPLYVVAEHLNQEGED